MLIDSPLLHTVQTNFEDDIFFDVCRVVFGINPEAVEDDNLRRAIFHAICERFIGITVNDIQEAFSRYEPLEKVYVLSRKDFIEPIERYWTKKSIIKSELKKQLEDVDSDANVESKRQAHKSESQQLYIQCAKADGIWTGTAFQAASFAEESFKHRFTKEEKDSIYKEAWHKVKELEAKQKLALMDSIEHLTPVPSNYQMFCQYLTLEACKRGFEIIVG